MPERLLREEWLNALPDHVSEVANDITNSIAEVIAERIKQIGSLSKTDAEHLGNAYAYLGTDMEKIKDIIAQKAKIGRQQVEKVFQEAAKANDSFARAYYESRGLMPLTVATDTQLQSFMEAAIRQTNHLFDNLSNTLAYKIPGKGNLDIRTMYTTAIDKSIYEIRSGTVSYNTALRKTVDQLATQVRINTINGQPVPVLQWESGYTRRLDSHVRQNILDGVRQMNQQMLAYHGEQFGSDGVELSAHAISAPDHAPLQGRQYSNDNFEKLQAGAPFEDADGKIYAGIKRPIGQWNCKHFAFPIILGVSSRSYTDEQLEEMEANSVKKYPLTQKQRAMECQLRDLKAKRLAESKAGFELEAKQTQRRINELTKQYKGFSKKSGLETQEERARVTGYRPISVKSLDDDMKKRYNTFKKEVHTKIKEEYPLTINEFDQGKHIVDAKNYDPTRSVLTADPKELINLYAGKSNPKNTKSWKWTNKEYFEHASEIGIYKDLNGNELHTNAGMIHYSKRKGVHIVPARPTKGEK